jgi:hypothetical protein
MKMDLRTSLPAAAVAIGCALVVTVRVAIAPAPTLNRPATDDERAEIAQAVAASERAWTNESTQNFPADSWSQRDDFHGRELRKVEELVKAQGIRIEDVLRAIDDDIHHRNARRPSTIPGGTLERDERHANAVPCKPRPFYD